MGFIVFNFGGGTNSVAAAVRAVRLGLPVDRFLFADTGGEMPETYRYIWDFSGWLVRHDYPAITIVQSHVAGEFESLEDNCLRLLRLPSKAYGFASCSSRWKTSPCWADVKALGMDQGIWIRGIDADESHRARPGDPKAGWLASFPLIDWNMGRQECVDEIVSAGLPLPGKSACWFCPSASVSEIGDLHDTHPDLFARGLAMERNAETHRNFGGWKNTLKGLGTGFSWQSVAASKRLQVALPTPTRRDSQSCGCYDGARSADILLAPDYCGTFDSTIPVGAGGVWPLARDWAHARGPAWTQEGLFS